MDNIYIYIYIRDGDRLLNLYDHLLMVVFLF